MHLAAIRPQRVGPMHRVGAKNDGGYVIPVKFPNASLLISFGLGDDWTFEKQLLKDGIISSFVCFDHTVSLRKLLKRIHSRLTIQNFSSKALLYRCLVLTQYFVDFKLRKYPHIRKEITNDASSKNKTNLLEISESISEKQFVLKIDIEGSEYQLIDQICSLVTRIPLLMIEFHDTEVRRESFEVAVAKLTELYLICHAHANNFEPLGSDGIPVAIEFTFGRKDIYVGLDRISFLPIHGLDSPSSANRADHQILFG